MFAENLALIIAQSNAQSRGVLVGIMIVGILMIIAGAVILALKKKK